MKEKVYTIKLTQKQLDTLSDIFHDFKDYNRGSEYSIIPAMEIEAVLTMQTGGAYFSDTTYDIK